MSATTGDAGVSAHNSMTQEQIDFCTEAAFQLVKAKKPDFAGEAFEVFGFPADKCKTMLFGSITLSPKRRSSLETVGPIHVS